MKKLYKEDLWNKILEEIELFSNDKTMEYYFKSNILNFNKLSDALSLLVSKNLKSQEIHEENISRVRLFFAKIFPDLITNFGGCCNRKTCWTVDAQSTLRSAFLPSARP